MQAAVRNQKVRNDLVLKNWSMGGGSESESPERPGFEELEYAEGDWSYRDSYTGYYRSWGMEVVRFKGEPVWSSLYGGGMIKGKENLANETFNFLKKAMSADEENFLSFRGPHELEDSEWRYKYNQDGDVFEFIDKAGKATYAGGGSESESPERPGFEELEY
ncbi:MAG: hypothetical protein CEO21_145, partial [Microgenomates group bacterium Gr01-1014_80]